MVDILVRTVQDNGFDGVYLDGTLNALMFANGIASALSKVSFDSDGDGLPNTVAQLIDQYVAWSPYFMASLRTRLGNSAIIVGNSAGSLSSPSLNGLTVEMESCLDLPSCMNALEGQQAVGVSPALSVLWLTHSESLPPQQQCARAQAIALKLPWVQIGTDFFDGSHIVRNSTGSLASNL